MQPQPRRGVGGRLKRTKKTRPGPDGRDASHWYRRLRLQKLTLSVFNDVKGGPEPLEKESHEFLGSKRDDRFSNSFFEMVPKTCQGSFFVPALE